MVFTQIFGNIRLGPGFQREEFSEISLASPPLAVAASSLPVCSWPRSLPFLQQNFLKNFLCKIPFMPADGRDQQVRTGSALAHFPRAKRAGVEGEIWRFIKDRFVFGKGKLFRQTTEIDSEIRMRRFRRHAGKWREPRGFSNAHSQCPAQLFCQRKKLGLWGLEGCFLERAPLELARRGRRTCPPQNPLRRGWRLRG